MWELPTVVLDPGRDASETLAAALSDRGLRGARVGKPLAEIRHAIMNRRITLAVFEVAGLRGAGGDRSPFRWMDPRLPLAITGAARKALRAIGLIED
jgi:hypothetical protein